MDSLSDIFNKFPFSLQSGDLVLVDNSHIKVEHKLNTLSGKYTIGILLSDAISADEVFDIDNHLESKNVYYKKVYRVFLHSKIIVVQQKFILEKVN